MGLSKVMNIIKVWGSRVIMQGICKVIILLCTPTVRETYKWHSNLMPGTTQNCLLSFYHCPWTQWSSIQWGWPQQRCSIPRLRQLEFLLMASDMTHTAVPRTGHACTTLKSLNHTPFYCFLQSYYNYVLRAANGSTPYIRSPGGGLTSTEKTLGNSLLLLDG